MEYGEQITLDPTKIYPPYVVNEGLLVAFDTKPLSLWHDLLGKDITQVIHSDFYEPTFNNNVEIGKLVAALKKNSLLSAKAPSTSVTIYHSRKDDFVPFVNAQEAHDKWSNSTLVELSSMVLFRDSSLCSDTWVYGMY